MPEGSTEGPQAQDVLWITDLAADGTPTIDGPQLALRPSDKLYSYRFTFTSSEMGLEQGRPRMLTATVGGFPVPESNERFELVREEGKWQPTKEAPGLESVKLPEDPLQKIAAQGGDGQVCLDRIAGSTPGACERGGSQTTGSSVTPPLLNCPQGWSGSPCTPPPPQNCPDGARWFMGEGCVGGTDWCPGFEGEWPLGVDEATAIHVAVAPQGAENGTRASPYGSLSAALANAPAGATIALSRGNHLQVADVMITQPGLRIVSGCPGDTNIVLSMSSLVSRGQDVSIQGLSIVATGAMSTLPGILAQSGSVLLSGAELRGGNTHQGSLFKVEAGGALTARHTVLESAGGRGVLELSGSATLEAVVFVEARDGWSVRGSSGPQEPRLKLLQAVIEDASEGLGDAIEVNGVHLEAASTWVQGSLSLMVLSAQLQDVSVDGALEHRSAIALRGSIVVAEGIESRDELDVQNAIVVTSHATGSEGAAAILRDVLVEGTGASEPFLLGGFSKITAGNALFRGHGAYTTLLNSSVLDLENVTLEGAVNCLHVRGDDFVELNDVTLQACEVGVTIEASPAANLSGESVVIRDPGTLGLELQRGGVQGFELSLRDLRIELSREAVGIVMRDSQSESEELEISDFTIQNGGDSVALRTGEEIWPVTMRQGKIKGGIAFDFPSEFKDWGAVLNELELDGVKAR